jgi:hypothetical protein
LLTQFKVSELEYYNKKTGKTIIIMISKTNDGVVANDFIEKFKKAGLQYPPPIPTPAPASTPEKPNKTFIILLILLILGGVGLGGGLILFFFIKKKKNIPAIAAFGKKLKKLKLF